MDNEVSISKKNGNSDPRAVLVDNIIFIIIIITFFL